MEEKKTKIAVSAFIVKDEKFLLLKRRTTPEKWGPPGGRVRQKETLTDAVIREVKEEANIDIKVLMPITSWSGEHGGEVLYSIGFLCEYVSGKVKVAEEHSQARWFNIEELKNEEVTHDVKDFIRAEEIKNIFNDKK